MPSFMPAGVQGGNRALRHSDIQPTRRTPAMPASTNEKQFSGLTPVNHGNYKLHVELAARLSLLDPQDDSPQQWRSVVDNNTEHLTFGGNSATNMLVENPGGEEDADKLLACPFFKRNPEKCLAVCGSGWPSIHRLK